MNQNTEAPKWPDAKLLEIRIRNVLGCEREGYITHAEADRQVKKLHAEFKAACDACLAWDLAHPPACECGSAKAGVAGHSSWCPAFDDGTFNLRL